VSNLAIIPARGGSKRIHRKNIRPFLGKPIMAYAIELALNSGLFDEVMVSTDDEEIADVAAQYGAKVPFLRSAETSNDHATTAAVIAEVVSDYARLGRDFEHLCCLYPATPLLTAQQLSAGFDLLNQGHFHTVFAAVPYDRPIWRAFQSNPDQSMSLIWPENALKRTQDLTPAYHDAGQFYWLNAAAFNASQTIFGSRTSAVVLAPEAVQDIDTEADWVLAEFKARQHGG
jgi:N-acylneuraminate cytidylyltransferase